MKPETNKDDFPKRKPNRLSLDRYTGQEVFFVTICTHNRKKIFTSASLVGAFTELLEEKSLNGGFGLYAYCFMPDHLHLELVGTRPGANLQKLIRAFKGTSTAVIRKHGVRNLWQKGFYDHILRSNEAADAVAWYIFNNTVRARLIEDWTQWPYLGSTMIAWRKLEQPLTVFVPAWKTAERAG